MGEEATTKSTAFKHPRCGGLVLMIERQGRHYFQCDECLATAEELTVLAVGKPIILRRGSRNDQERKQDV